MRFDEQGHLVVTPRELQEKLNDPYGLIHQILLPGTPAAIPTHEQHCQLLDHLATALSVHPRNMLFKGSTKIGFSIAPKPEKVWCRYCTSSDLDLAIVDPVYFSRLDEQVRHWERRSENRQNLFLRNTRQGTAYRNRVRQKGQYECYRFFDLPPILALEELNEALSKTPVSSCCGVPREITAFVFRDWWGVYSRYDFDLSELRRELRQTRLPPAEDQPRPHPDE
jgi:hypothetical protein